VPTSPATTRRGAALQISGKPGAFSMERPTDPVEVAKLARQLYSSGVWKTAPKAGGAWEKYRYTLHARLPEALLVLPPLALHALTKRTQTCSWCAVRLLSSLDGLDDLAGERSPEPEPTAWNLELLGVPCRSCRSRHADRAERRKAEQQAEAAAGARFAIAAIERQDGKLAGKIAELAVRHGWPPEIAADAIKAAASPVRSPGISSAPARRPVRPPAGRQRPGIGLQRKTRQPSYYTPARFDVERYAERRPD
jgi:hypothetical protein